MTNFERSFERFRTTPWTLIGALDAGGDERHRAAMDQLVRSYWAPVYAYLRSRGQRRDSAAELTQAFFSEVVIGRELFGKADRDRGRLRTLILTALKRFRIDLDRSIAAQARRVHLPLEALEEEDARLGGPNGAIRPEELFERRWALAVLQEALRRCERHFRTSGRAGHWELFETRVLQPAVAAVEAPRLADVAGSFGFESPELAAAAVQVVKRRMVALLREVVAETVDDAEDVERELADIRLIAEG